MIKKRETSLAEIQDTIAPLLHAEAKEFNMIAQSLLSALNAGLELPKMAIAEFSHADWDELVNRLRPNTHPNDVTSAFRKIHHVVLLDMAKAADIVRLSLSDAVEEFDTEMAKATILPMYKKKEVLKNAIKSSVYRTEVFDAKQHMVSALQEVLYATSRSIGKFEKELARLGEIYKGNEAIRKKFTDMDSVARASWLRKAIAKAFAYEDREMVILERYQDRWMKIRFFLGFEMLEYLRLRLGALRGLDQSSYVMGEGIDPDSFVNT